jgi:hypothetical protein
MSDRDIFPLFDLQEGGGGERARNLLRYLPK